MNILVPITIDSSVLSSSTIAEPASGETVWVSGASYALGDRCIRTETHRVYESLIAHSGRIVAPEDDGTYWMDYGPTGAWAMLDTEVSTQSVIVSPLTVVLRPGFFNAVALYGLEGGNIAITVRDQPGGNIIHSTLTDLVAPPLDWYDWAFGRIKSQTKLLVKGIEPYPDAELTVSISAAAGVSVKAGMLVVGDYVSLIGDESAWGGTEYGASVEPVDYSYISTDDFGKTSIKRRRNTTDLRCKVILPKAQATQALEIVQSVLSVPCAWVASEKPQYAGLNAFGLGSGTLGYESSAHVVLNIYVKGLV